MDLFILGPSNSGKTYLANFLASKFALPVFNCDSIQIYRYLNSLTNKPEFLDQNTIKEEIVSYTSLQLDFQNGKYEDIYFDIYFRKKGNIEVNQFDSVIDLLEFVDKNINLEKSFRKLGKIENFLFDIKNPGEAYSTLKFEKDVERITKKFDFHNRIIVGGTIYYAFNYLMRLNQGYELDFESDKQLDLDKYELDDLIDILKEKDPKSLEFIDLKNRRRVENAVKFVIMSSRKYSDEYFRKPGLRDDFLLIILKPKDRNKHYRSLDEIIDLRFNQKTFDEISFLIQKYGENVIPWLQKTSYEYKYFLQIYLQLREKCIESALDKSSSKSQFQEILQTLKYKEHQYVKRQITFLRRLERWMKHIITNNA